MVCLVFELAPNDENPDNGRETWPTHHSITCRKFCHLDLDRFCILATSILTYPDWSRLFLFSASLKSPRTWVMLFDFAPFPYGLE